MKKAERMGMGFCEGRRCSGCCGDYSDSGGADQSCYYL